MLERFVIQHTSIWPNFKFDRTYDSKEKSISVTCIVQQYLWWCHKLWNADFTKRKILISLEVNIIFSSNKKFINYIHIKCCFMTKNSFIVEVTFKVTIVKVLLMQHSFTRSLLSSRLPISKVFINKDLLNICVMGNVMYQVNFVLYGIMQFQI